MLTCPFCGAPETDRIELEGRRFLVFRCMFTPEVDRTLDDSQIAEHLRANFAPGASTGYFRGMCDRLHLYVTKGEGGKTLTSDSASSSPP
ncbi:MAG: hypothetical protein ACREDK_01030 [Thermoplasmata archaeon]